MDEIGEDSRHQKLANFRLLYLILQMIGITIIILMFSWVFIFLGGVSWSATPGTQFNWHPLLMTIGMIYLYGNCKIFKQNICPSFRMFMRFFVCLFLPFYSHFNLSWTSIYPQAKFKTITCHPVCNDFPANAHRWCSRLRFTCPCESTHSKFLLVRIMQY